MYDQVYSSYASESSLFAKTERLSGLAIVKSFVKYKVLDECKIQKVKGRVYTFV